MNFQHAFHVGQTNLIENKESDRDLVNDPRGVVWMFEPPMPDAHYVIGCDPTVGITGWNRSMRTKEDHKVDNAAIEVFRIGAVPRIVMKGDKPEIDSFTKKPKIIMADKQVCEFAAPVDAVETARILCLLGRIYKGDAEEYCELIYEAYPGPGVLTTQELLRLGYSNLWHWEYIDSEAEETNRIGWRSSRESQKLLWYRARRHLMEKRFQFESPWLIKEYATAETNIDTQRAKAATGFHDDRFQAANMAFWAAHKWTYDPERSPQPVTSSPDINWQTYAPVIGQEKRSWRDDLADW
jgi:hypothetical protein